MKFPGSKSLHHWELSTETVFSVEHLLRSCRQVNLTGFAEVTFPQAAAMIFFYAGSPVNALYRRGPLALHGRAALDRLRTQIDAEEGSIGIYEMPLDMAHLLRGIVNRKRLDALKGAEGLSALLERLALEQHTGTLELTTTAGAAMMLLVSGHVSNTYWETVDGVTFEKAEARQKLEEALAATGGTMAFLSAFSRDTWRSRPEAQEIGALFDEQPPASPDTSAPEAELRRAVLAELQTDLPSSLQSLVFDLATGVVLARHVRGPDALKAALFTEKIAPLTLHIRERLAVEERDDVEVIEVSTHHVATVVAIVPDALEAIAVMADKAQPSVMLAGALTRAAASYGRRLRALRQSLA